MPSDQSSIANSCLHHRSARGPNLPVAVARVGCVQKCQPTGQNVSYSCWGETPIDHSGKVGCVSGVGSLILRFAAIQVPVYSYSPVCCVIPTGSRNCFRTTPLFPSAPTSHCALIDSVRWPSPELPSVTYSTTAPSGSSSRPMTLQPTWSLQNSDFSI